MSRKTLYFPTAEQIEDSPEKFKRVVQEARDFGAYLIFSVPSSDVESRTYGYNGERYVCYFHFVEWYCISLGLHLDLRTPNLEIHLPFGFIRIGKNSDHAPNFWAQPFLVRCWRVLKACFNPGTTVLK